MLVTWQQPPVFAPAQLFSAGEPGVHFEAYDPNVLLERRNLFTDTENFTSSVWTFVSGGVTATANAAVAPDGTTTAEKFVAMAAHGTKETYNSTGPSVGRTGAQVTVSVYAKAAELGWIYVCCNVDASTHGWYVDLSDGTAGNSVGASPGTLAITSVGDGWYRIAVTKTQTSAGSAYIEIWPAQANGVSAPSFTGDDTSGLYVWGRQFEYASSASTYQKVTDWNTEYLAAAVNSVTMWQDSDGTTPVTAVEQTVGLWLDQSRSMARGSQNLADPGFDDSSKWTTSATWSVAGSACTLTNCLNTDGPVGTAAVAIVAGTSYEVIVVVTAVTLGGIRVTVGGVSSPGSITAAGTYRYQIVAGSTAAPRITANGTTSGVVTTFSVQAVAGSHATQSTSASRPRLKARYNQLTKTEVLTDAGTWLNSTAVVAATTVAAVSGTLPDGTTGIFYRLTIPAAAGASSRSLLYQNSGATQVAGQALRAAIYAKRVSGGTEVAFNIESSSSGPPTGYVDGLKTITDSWARYTVDGPITGSAAGSHLFGIGFDGRIASQTATAAIVVDVWGPDLRIGDDIGLNNPTYQRVNTSTDYDTAGFIHYLQADGTDDSFVVTLDLSSANKATIWVGQTKLSDAGAAIILEHTSAGTNDGSFQVAGPNGAAAPNYQVVTRGTVSIAAHTYTTYTAPDKAVLVSQMDNSAGSLATQVTTRVNGAVVASSSSSGGTSPGNYASSTLNIFRRNNTNLPFNGRATSITVRGTTVATSTTLLQQMEQYAARKAGQTFTST